MKSLRREYNKGIGKILILFVICMIILEGLSLYFPMLLQNLTKLAENGKTANEIILWGLLVLLFIILIFGIQFLTEYLGAVFTDKYQQNIRKSLYNKFSRMSADQLDQIGISRILPTIMNDTTWLKGYFRRIVSICIYFPVAILGSFAMLFMLEGFGNFSSWIYGVFALASLPFILVFFWINMRRLGKIIPESVNAYDEYFFNIKEGIAGAKDIRILGKAKERTAEFEKFVKLQRRQGLVTDQAINLSVGFNAILFSLVTIAIIIYGAYVNVKTAHDLVILNTAIQYINKIWSASHTVFTWFVDYLPRNRFTKKRLNGFYSMPEEIRAGGLDKIPVYTKHSLQMRDVSFNYSNGQAALSNINIIIPDGQSTAVAGGIGSGKNVLAQLLVKLKQPNGGEIFFNDIDIKQLNPMFWRKSVISYCSDTPNFIPGTIRENMKLLAPEATDVQIIKAFNDLGAADFVKKFDNILDFQINESNTINNSTKNLLNLVRSFLKPADIYIFNQCFDHVKHSYIIKLMARLKKEKKTCFFISYDKNVCKYCNNIYVLKNGRISGSGTHESLIRSSVDYRNLQSSTSGIIVNEEKFVENLDIDVKPAEVQL